jgi:hypothetical protein
MQEAVKYEEYIPGLLLAGVIALLPCRTGVLLAGIALCGTQLSLAAGQKGGEISEHQQEQGSAVGEDSVRTSELGLH